MNLDIAFRLHPPPPYTKTRSVMNPFMVGLHVWSKATGNQCGVITQISLQKYAPHHWALVDGDLYVFDYQLHTTYTLSTDAIKPTNPWHIGQRIFYHGPATTRPVPAYSGTVVYIFPSQIRTGTYGIQTNRFGQHYTMTELEHGTVTIGQRKQPTLV